MWLNRTCNPLPCQTTPYTNDCEPISVWMMTRHGTRHPEEKEIHQMRQVIRVKKQILNAHMEGRGELCAQDIENLYKWEWRNALDLTPSELTPEGFVQLRSLASRLEERYYKLLKSLDEYQMRASHEERTQMSASAFLQGLRKTRQYFKISTSFPNDLTTRPYRYCRKRYEDILIGPKIPKEINEYINTEDFKRVQSSVQNRTGLLEPLTPKQILSLYDVCRYYRSYTVLLQDPWCAIFTNQDLKHLEFVEDIRHYYRNGHGQPMNAKLGGSSLKDLYNKFVRAKKGVKSFSVFFSHDTLLGMMYAALGLYKDDPEITGNKRAEDRKWRTSYLTPYAANFIAILNKCKNPTGSTYKVQFFVNEKELEVCEGGPCNWIQFVDKFKNFTHSNLDFCQNVSNKQF
ncbi:multiple inositol polyphosphate phosphatase 1-like isoform X2 [Leptidea sinapis]|uniref:multiple inositol polyphosphate phosphatase 1-like isoform X2 n=1 Tax=Leptidea sinapis TaxID=189913 RepID=UPI0021C42223|nr:multiple inositol polyphosphate phosphatase 1-like isoform X2 [Leptidea sinapis]